MASVRFEGVWKRYGGVAAVKALSLACADGEMLALLGPSGCGKSTTLKMAAGLEEISEGELFFGDRPVTRLSAGARNIAMVFEDYALYPRMTVRENVAFPLKVRGIADAAAERRIADVLELLDLGGMAGRGVKGLSGGAQQRVSIGRALVRDPELILFDEPLSHLDSDQKVQLRAEIKRLQKIGGVTSILVTHDQTEATAMADRIAVMSDGVLQQVGTPQELYERPANLFVANFIGEPPMNLLPAEIGSGDCAPLLRGAGWSAALDPERARRLERLPPGARVTVGIRPEHVALSPAGGAAGVPAFVRHREPRGDADVLRLEFGDTAAGLVAAGPATVGLVAEVAGPSAWRAGAAAAATLPAHRLHLFDAGSGRALEAA